MALSGLLSGGLAVSAQGFHPVLLGCKQQRSRSEREQSGLGRKVTVLWPDAVGINGLSLTGQSEEQSPASCWKTVRSLAEKCQVLPCV